MRSPALLAAVLAALLTLFPSSPGGAADREQPALDIVIITDEAEACLAIIDSLREGRTVRPSEWERLYRSDGYQRLKRREAAMGRAFGDSTFPAFLRADSTVGRANDLRETVAEWTRADPARAGRLALAYLPAGARIRAKVYLLIKPWTNSFVFEQRTDPAIMLYVDPAIPRAKLENTMAHELHHIGYSAACARDTDSTLTLAASTCRTWLTAFGEGLAMLAAAGGPTTHPHAASDSAERARWDRDMGSYAEDFASLAAFFGAILDGRLADPDSIRARGMSFFGTQGPWYTVGYKMAVVVEQAEGRAALVAGLCDPVELLRAYNRAASDSPGAPTLPLWPRALLDRLGSPPKG